MVCMCVAFSVLVPYKRRTLQAERRPGVGILSSGAVLASSRARTLAAPAPDKIVLGLPGVLIAEWTGAWFPARSHKPSDAGSNPASATSSGWASARRWLITTARQVQLTGPGTRGRVRKPAKRPGREPGEVCGFDSRLGYFRQRG